MLKILKNILNLLLPPRCKLCGAIVEDDDTLCSDCYNKFDFITQPYCSHCGHPFDDVYQIGKNSSRMLCATCAKDKKPWFRLCRSAYKYQEESKNLILSFKFHDCTDDAKILAKWMFRAGDDIWNKGVDVIVPVPLHYSRLVKRKYNQAAMLAVELSKLTGIPVDLTHLIRHRKTRPQVEFSGHVRVKNVKGAFSIKSIKAFQGKRVLLVDDVLTTSSTLKECAKAIAKAKPKSIDLLTAARVC